MGRIDTPVVNGKYICARLLAAGAAGVSSAEFPPSKSLKSIVHRLRRKGVLPIFSIRKEGGARYWANEELATGAPGPTNPRRPVFVGPPKPTTREKILGALSAAPGGIPRRDLDALGSEFTVSHAHTAMSKAGEIFFCLMHWRSTTICFSTAERRDAYLASKPPKVRKKYPRPAAQQVTKPAKPKPPAKVKASKPLKLAPSKPKPPAVVSGPVITPPGLMPVVCEGFKPRTFAPEIVEPYFSGLGIGSYPPSQSAVARAYGSRVFHQVA